MLAITGTISFLWICQECESGTFSGLLNPPQLKGKTAKVGGSKTSMSCSKRNRKTIGSKVSMTSTAEAHMLLIEEEEHLNEA